ncbi:MAG: endonuclease/exonuclease/phosphatase family protein [Clostridia bacterium]|nr:endonuclease/exonuclease/phosphatase family protein [Clostridia bacterium]
MKKGVKIVSVIVAVAAVIGIGATVLTKPDTIDFGEVKLSEIPARAEGATRVMSFNVRCISDDNGHTIANRSQLVTAVLEQYAPDTFGVQEATPKWLKIIDAQLGDKYARVGEGRAPIEMFSEYSCVYYLKDKYNLLDSGTIWLSETPEKKYTKDFDSKHNRIASWAVLEDKTTGEKFTHINTHLDHVLESTRVEQVKVLKAKIAELEKETTVICTGDFNTFETAEAYAEMRKDMDDTKLIAASSDTGITFHNYGAIEEHEDGAIDFVFATKGTKAATYKIIRDCIDGIYPSDHYPIMADIIL